MLNIMECLLVVDKISVDLTSLIYTFLSQHFDEKYNPSSAQSIPEPKLSVPNIYNVFSAYSIVYHTKRDFDRMAHKAYKSVISLCVWLPR